MARVEQYAGADLELRDALLGFAEMREKKKARIDTNRMLTLLLSQLDKLSGGVREKKIAIIDSFSTAGEEVLILRKARALIEEDPERDFDQLAQTLYDYQQSLQTVFTLECFDNLVKNGRMKPLVGTLLQTLGIHVIADAAPEGVVRVRDKARGEANTFKRMVKLMAEVKDPTDAEVIIAHCNNEPGALRLKKAILDTLPVKSVELIPTRGLCSFYAMDKGLIVGF